MCRASTPGPITNDNTWHQVTLVIPASGSVAVLYTDGVASPCPSGQVMSGAITSTYSVLLGAYNGGGSTYVFQGQMTET